ncbi:hypothetical protein BJF78_11695 [Pseudonocardia sp. CNS-139]|nr:hypothetical protein BJF78_11695 [Pseudonocardia sp. CNS-139]
MLQQLPARDGSAASRASMSWSSRGVVPGSSTSCHTPSPGTSVPAASEPSTSSRRNSTLPWPARVSAASVVEVTGPPSARPSSSSTPAASSAPRSVRSIPSGTSPLTSVPLRRVASRNTPPSVASRVSRSSDTGSSRSRSSTNTTWRRPPDCVRQLVRVRSSSRAASVAAPSSIDPDGTGSASSSGTRCAMAPSGMPARSGS